MHAALFPNINQNTKLEVPSDNHSTDVTAVQNVNRKLSYRRGTARLTMSVEILSAAAQLYEKSHLKTFAVSEQIYLR